MSSHPVTLFTGQWADLPFEEVARLAAAWGYDGLEIAASGDHLDLRRADEDDAYAASRREILDRHGLQVFAISNHLAGQAVCDDPIDFRHQGILRPYVWGDGEAEGVRQRAAEDMKRAARVAGKLGVDTVVGFTGSSIWPYVAMFPPVPESVIEQGFQDFADRWNPILDVFDAEGVRFAHEVHPGEIAYDYWSSARALDAIDHRDAFGFNWDPSHMMWQNIDWDFVSTGHGDVPWEDAFRALDAIGYDGPISIEWEDAGMDRLHGAPEALTVVRSLLWPKPEASFDAAFRNQ